MQWSETGQPFGPQAQGHPSICMATIRDTAPVKRSPPPPALQGPGAWIPLSSMPHTEHASCEPGRLSGAGMQGRSARLAHERQHLNDRRVGHVQDEPRRRVDRRVGHERVHAAEAVARERRQPLQVCRRADMRGAADRLNAARAQVAQRLVHVCLRARSWIRAHAAARAQV